MIRYYHIRHKDEAGVVQAKGGMTIAYDTETRMAGCAVCSLKDNYWKFEGRKIAESRLRHHPVIAFPQNIRQAVPVTAENPQAFWAGLNFAKFCLGVPIVGIRIVNQTSILPLTGTSGGTHPA